MINDYLALKPLSARLPRMPVVGRAASGAAMSAATTVMPNVVLAGVPKAGTSALANYLAGHPDFVVTAIKEPNYFNLDLPFGHFTTPEAYAALFEAADGRARKFRCDASILYCYSEVAAERLAASAPGVRAVIMLRNPIDAMHAWHGQMCYTGNEPIADFARALDAESERRRTGSTAGLVGLAARCPQLLWYRRIVSYAEQVKRFQLHLGSENVLVLLYDDFVRDASATFDTLLAFVGADRSFRPSFERVNEARRRRWPRVHRLLKRIVASPSRRALPAALRHRLICGWDEWTTVAMKRDGIPPALRARLVAELKSEVDAIATLLGRDLAAWSQ